MAGFLGAICSILIILGFIPLTMWAIAKDREWVPYWKDEHSRTPADVHQAALRSMRRINAAYWQARQAMDDIAGQHRP